jgi:hypothetical protein
MVEGFSTGRTREDKPLAHVGRWRRPAVIGTDGLSTKSAVTAW